MLARLFSVRGDLAYLHSVFSVETKNLAWLKRNCCLGIANLYSVDLYASLFNESRDFAMGFLEIEHFAINIRNECDGCKYVPFS
jgi:hypothetical protein